MKDFDLEAAKRGAAVCTAYGLPVRILCFDRKGGNFPIIALIDDTDSSESFATFTEEGEENPCLKTGITLMMRDDDYLEKLERGEYDHIADACKMVGTAIKQNSTTDREYWRRVYAGQAITGLVCGLIINNYNGKMPIPKVSAKGSIEIADALIEELEKTETK